MINRYSYLKKNSFFFFLSYLSILLFSIFLYTSSFSEVLSYKIFLKSIITTIFLWYILYLSSFNKYFYYLVIFLLTVVTTIKIYYTFILCVHIEPSIFEGIFDTNLDEIKRVSSNKPLFIFFIVLLYFSIIIEFNWFKTFTFKKRVKIHLIKIFIVICLLIGYEIYRNNLHIQSFVKLLKSTYPINFVNNFYKAFDSRYKLYIMNKNKVDIVKKYKFSIQNDENMTIVFVRGESLRARSFPISDKNIPLKYRLDDINNIIYYNNVFSYANYTQAAVPWMLTRSINNRLQNEKSLISVLRYVGFDTTWIGCDHSNLSNFATPIVNYSLEANRSLFIGKLNDWLKQNKKLYIAPEATYKIPKDKVNLPKQKYFMEVIGSNVFDGLQFSYLISKINTKKVKKQFFWVEMNGSHVPWSILVPKKLQFFKPICTKVLDEINQCSQQQSVNSYNNTILYTQYLLKRLILSLKNKNAIVFFASDHGESTGENGYYGHGFMLPKDKRRIRDQINPAFMVWMSNKFISKHKKHYISLKKNANKYIKHNFIFHSVLDIAGVKSSIIDKSKSIFSNKCKEATKEIIDINKTKNIIVNYLANNRIIFHLKKKNPKEGYKGIITLKIKKNIKGVKVFISDLYKNKSYPNRIIYKLIYNKKILLQKDLAKDDKTLREIKFLQNDHNVIVEIEAQKGIERDWAWGDVAKIELNFIKN